MNHPVTGPGTGRTARRSDSIGHAGGIGAAACVVSPALVDRRTALGKQREYWGTPSMHHHSPEGPLHHQTEPDVEEEENYYSQKALWLSVLCSI
ncbi:unnamed protein product [Lota lota]